MKKLVVLGILLSVFFIPSVSHAAITITNVTVNGASTTTVKPLSIIRVTMSVQVTQGSKWEGIKWGINNNGTVTFPAFVNLDNNDRRDHDGEGWRDDDHRGDDDYRNSCSQNHNSGNGTFTEKFYIIAPFKVGLYNANFLAFEKKKGNNKPLASGPVFVLPNAVRVATTTTTPPPPPADTVAPVIAAHADVFATATNASGTIVSYTDPAATDNVDASVAVSCIPASGSTFAIGTTTVSCDASDAAGNAAIPSTFSVIVAPPADTQAPVIAAHENISVPGGASGAVVTYANPTATDNVDASITVSCTPASGSLFPAGDTSVTCAAQDTAGNAATPVTFTVTTVPTPVVLASQPDESFVCALGSHSNGWQDCFSTTGGITTVDFGVTQNGYLGDVKIALDAPVPSSPSDYWGITASCFTDAARTSPCAEWTPVVESASDNLDGKHFVAHFSGAQTLTSNRYYTLTINDAGWSTGAYGSQSLGQLFWELSGLPE